MKDSILPITESITKYSNGFKNNPDVSVIVTTYNHAKFIKECIDSIISQRTDFSYEIIIGEDDSTDDTRKLCKELADKYPDIISLFLHSRKNILLINGRQTGRFNFIFGLCQARGKYIAICDGDDYWTDINKLQKQFDFLESNSDYSASSHWVDIVYEDKSPLRSSKFRYEGDIGIVEILQQRWTIIQTSSLVFRASYINTRFINSLLNYQITGDSFLIAYLSSKGNINSIEKVMSIYRKQSGGLTYHSGDFETRGKYFAKKIKSYNGIIRYYKIIDEIYNFQERKLIDKYIIGLKIDIFFARFKLNEGSIFSRAIKKIFSLN